MTLNINSVSASYGNIRALWNVSVVVENGTIVSLIGANAAGKSTLLKCVMGIVKPQTGSISFQGRELGGMTPHTIVEEGVGYVPEGRRLFPTMSVAENLRLGAPRNCPDLNERTEFVENLFPILRDRLWQSAGTLSGGEQQMVAIGRALMRRPKILILDELSFGLAPKMFERVIEAIEKINERGVSILLAEQNAERALEISNTGYVLENGRITASGPSKELLNDSRVRSAYLGVSAEESIGSGEKLES